MTQDISVDCKCFSSALCKDFPRGFDQEETPVDWPENASRNSTRGRKITVHLTGFLTAISSEQIEGLMED